MTPSSTAAGRVGLHFRIAALLVGFLPALAQGMPALSLAPPGEAPGFPRVFFGMHVHNNPNRPRQWPTIPIGSLRLWDSLVSWPQVEPRRDEWQFARLDEYVSWATSHNVEVLLPLGLSPTWASARPQEASSYGSTPGSGAGYAAEPANIDDWRNYVRAVGQRYKGRIHYYELWNEVTDKGFFTGQIADLVRLAVAAKAELAAIDPTIKLVAPSAVSLGEAQTSLPADFMAAGGRQAADIASFHLYHGDHAPELKLGMAPNIRRRLVSRGFNGTPVWNTETGYFLTPPASVTTRGAGKYEITQQQAAQYVPRDMLLARAMGFERFFWFAWDSDYLGFLEPRTGELRPHGKVLGQFVKLLTDSRLAGCDRDIAGLWRCQLTLASGARAQAVWMDPAAAAPVTFDAPFAGQLVLLDGVDAGSTIGAKITAGQTVQILIRSQSGQ